MLIKRVLAQFFVHLRKLRPVYIDAYRGAWHKTNLSIFPPLPYLVGLDGLLTIRAENLESQTRISMVWIKVVNVEPELDWIRVPLSGVEYIHDLQLLIKEQLAPALNDYSIGQLTVKATLDTDPTNAVTLSSKDNLKSILDQFGVHDTNCTVRQSFSEKFTLFVEALLSQSDLLKLRPPSLHYINRVKLTGTTKPSLFYTKPTFGRTLQSFATWEGFKDDVNGAIWDHTPKYAHPIFPKYGKMANEEDIRDAINHNVLLPLNVLLESDGAGEEFARSIYLGETLGEPDFIQHSNEKLRLVIEVKSKWALSTSDLVETYTQNLINHHKKKQKNHQLSQIFGYLSHNELRYGVLTTYDKTWFLYRENPDHFCISPPIQHDDLQPTLFQCLFYLVSLARYNHKCASARSLHNDDDDHGDDGGGDYGDSGDDDHSDGGDDGDSSDDGSDDESSGQSESKRQNFKRKQCIYNTSSGRPRKQRRQEK